ncbi:MAG: NAD(P)/FAD-dependent oxidoreductase [Bacteroidota bacterium]|nr:NAD(P)/FAD-dependent oxidoreductase [Bacteroidota bacterium]
MNEFKKRDKENPVVIIGGGASGMIAAWRAASLGAPTILLEKNKKLGIKILISGGGKCNITHDGSIEDLLKSFQKNEVLFLKPSVYKFNNRSIVKLLEDRGVETYTRDDGKVFPKSNDASDVVAALEWYLRKSGVEIRTDCCVQEIIFENEAVTGVKLNNEIIYSSNVILATGGMSYPQTGTTGDGFRFVEKTGHTIVPLRPALAPIKLSNKFPYGWGGVAIRDAELICLVNNRKTHSEQGDFLFTHEGISGPVVLELSKYAPMDLTNNKVELILDTLPDKDASMVDSEIQQLISVHPNKQIGKIAGLFLPNRIVNHFLNSIHIDPEKECKKLIKEERKQLVKLLKEMNIGTVASIDITKGEITAGGISLKEVDPKTMQSRLVRGLFLSGEVLDIAGRIGGYNLQAAYSTGFTAGESAAINCKSQST